MEAVSVIKQNSQALLDSKECNLLEDAMTLSMLDLLEEGGVIEVPRVSSYANTNQRGTLWKINGFSINNEEHDYTVDLFITDYSTSEEPESISKKEMVTMKDRLLKFFDACLSDSFHNVQEYHQIYQLARDIHKNKKDISKVDLYVLTNRKFQNIHKQVTNEELKGIDINIHYWDITRFNSLLNSTDHRNILDIEISEYQDVGIKCIETSSSYNYKCYMAVISGELLADLYRDFDTKLLESNVRSFLQQIGKVNKGIRDTILYKPEMFLPYNNGLSATASEVTVNDNGEITSLKDFQIVNGGQTTASLYYTRKKHSVPLDKVNVAMKLTILDNEELKGVEVPNISRFANTQNKVSEIDLSSNHPFLVEMEKLSKSSFFYDPVDRSLVRYWFFERSNGQYREALNKLGTLPRKKIFKSQHPNKFKKADVAKWMNLFNNKPYLVSQGSQKSFLNFIRETAQEYNDAIDKRFYVEFIGKGVLFKWFDTCYGRYNTDPVGDTNIKSYVVSYTLSLLSYYLGDTLDFHKIGTKQQINPDLRDKTRDLLRHTYDYLVKKASGGLVSEFAKKKYIWDEFIRLSPSINIDDLLKDYLKDGGDDQIVDTREYLIRLDALAARGSHYWDALKLFADPANSGDRLSMAEKNNIDKGYNYFFRLRGNLSATYLSKLTDLAESIEQKFDIEEILKLSKRNDKPVPSFLEMYDNIADKNESFFETLRKNVKQSKSRIVDKYLRAISAFNFKKLNFDEMSLDELRYLTWCIDKFGKKGRRRY